MHSIGVLTSSVCSEIVRNTVTPSSNFNQQEYEREGFTCCAASEAHRCETCSLSATVDVSPDLTLRWICSFGALERPLHSLSGCGSFPERERERERER